MAEQYFNLNLYDPAVPAFCSFDKMYVGTIDEIRVVMNRLAKTKDYVGTVKAWKAYCTGGPQRDPQRCLPRHSLAHARGIRQLITAYHTGQDLGAYQHLGLALRYENIRRPNLPGHCQA